MKRKAALSNLARAISELTTAIYEGNDTDRKIALSTLISAYHDVKAAA